MSQHFGDLAVRVIHTFVRAYWGHGGFFFVHVLTMLQVIMLHNCRQPFVIKNYSENGSKTNNRDHYGFLCGHNGSTVLHQNL